MRYTFHNLTNPFSEEGQFIPNAQMIEVVQDYIYQEKGVKVEIQDPERMRYNNVFGNRRHKELLCKAYEWAINHIKK